MKKMTAIVIALSLGMSIAVAQPVYAGTGVSKISIKMPVPIKGSDKNQVVIPKGEKTTFVVKLTGYSGKPLYQSDCKVVFTSSSKTKATISEPDYKKKNSNVYWADVQVKPNAPGKFELKAKVKKKNLYVYWTVCVSTPIDRIAINKEVGDDNTESGNGTIMVGDTLIARGVDPDDLVLTTALVNFKWYVIGDDGTRTEVPTGVRDEELVVTEEMVGHRLMVEAKPHSYLTGSASYETSEAVIEYRERLEEPDAPKNLGAQKCSAKGNKDGKITGVTTAMEYQLEGAKIWTPVTGNEITGLAEGTYYVRYMATDKALASKKTKVSVGAVATVSAPKFSPMGGSFPEPVDVAISSTTKWADIYYTLDDSEPTVDSEKYSEPIHISETTTVRAIAVKEGSNNSSVVSATYEVIKEEEGPKITKDPEGISELMYDGEEHALITPGEVKDGELYYAVQKAVADENEDENEDENADENADTLQYRKEIPTAAEPGIYYVWYKAVDTEKKIESEPELIIVTIYNRIRIHFLANGGTGIMDDQDAVTYDETKLNANKFSREGFRFTGWNTKANGDGDSYEDGGEAEFAEDTDLYAQWEPAAPSTVVAGNCTTADNNDGRLIGVTTAMEYKKADATGWTAGTGGDITGLGPGTYYVRVKATGTALASDNQTLTIEAYTAPTHTHSFTYSASGATITVTCEDTSCDLHSSPATLTLSAANATYTGSAYAGASLSDTTAWTGAGLTVPTIEYVGRGNTSYTKNTTAPTNAGTYTASITVGEGNGEATASVEYTIAPATISSVTVTGIDTPTATVALDTAATTSTSNVTLETVTWSPATTPAAYATVYTATLTAVADTNYVFADAVTATVNESSTNVTVTKNQDGTLSISYTFNKTALTPVTITPSDKEVSNYADGITIPVEGMFTITEGAGQATYTVTNGTGEGSYNEEKGKLTVTKCGTFTVKVSTAATETHAAGAESTATLTVKIAQTASEGDMEYDNNVSTSNVKGVSVDAVGGQMKAEAESDSTDIKENQIKEVTVTMSVKTVEEENVAKNEQAAITRVADTIIPKEDQGNVVSDYLDLSVKKSVIISDVNGQNQIMGSTTVTTTMKELGNVVDIPVQYDLSGKYNPVVVRVHNGVARAFIKLGAAPAPRDLQDADGSFYIEGEGQNAVIHIYTKLFSTYAVLSYGANEYKNAAIITEEPTAKETVYTGQAMVTAGKASGGTMQYVLSKNNQSAPETGWSDSIPIATGVGTYYVWYKVVGDVGYRDTNPTYIPVTVSSKPSSYTPTSTTYDVTFIVVNGAWDDGRRENKTFSSITRLSSSQIPAVGNKPDEGYMAGSWNKTPSTSINKNTTYIYTYAEKPLPEVVTEPTAKDLTEDGIEQELIIPGTASGGTMQYTVGASDGTYSSSIPKATEAGIYYVWYKVEGDADHRDTDPTSIEVTIKENTKPAATIVTAPTAKDLTANGEAQELVYAGEASGGTMEYGVSIITPTTWSSTIPTATNAGTYTVWYRAKGDEEHSSSKPQFIVVTIKYGANTLVYNGEEQNLVIPGSAEGGTMLYALGTDDVIPPEGNWIETVPTAKDPGTYYVWYKVEGDANHNDVPPVCIKVTIVPDTQVMAFEEGVKTLPEEVTRDDEELVEALRKMYDDLSADQKSQIPEEDVKKLEAAENTLEELKAEDQGKADAVATLIDQLPDNAKPENKTAVDAVLKQYEALTDDQKALLPAAEKEKIEALKAAFAGPSEEDQAVVTQFTEAVSAVSGNKAGEGKALVDNMTEMLSSMTDAQKALIPADTMALYNEAVDAFRPGRKFCSGDGYYKVLSNGDVAYHHPADETITSAVVPNQVKKGKYFFKVIKVSNYAFDGCENLEWIVIHKNVRVIGEDAFNGTSALTKINIKGYGIVSGKVTDAFEGAGKNGRLTVKVPKNKVNEYRELFTGEGGLNGSVKAA